MLSPIRMPVRPAAPVNPTLAEAVARSLRILQVSPLDAEPTRRLTCMLGIIQTPGVNDSYINGFDTTMQSVVQPLPPVLFARLLGHVRADLATRWFGAGFPDASVRLSLRVLDERIFTGVAYMNKQMHTQGAAMAPGKVQIKDWMRSQQQNPRSIYSCYGGVRDRR